VASLEEDNLVFSNILLFQCIWNSVW